ncbi:MULTISPECIES: hypothetical protein [Caballeronia]|uniref:Uncharacterized protein n=1 Tax=Caballeronia zhejiangensis TaxID=871203 RepID=A0A656QAD1_9BURK|nr:MULTISPECIES: hypothetical protein [Caballeronia]KDR24764.1 hypothetical protein BG60_34155 [Caballeronia zhejiangensis]MDR5770133.1 hypothetical protein [Caballeronia sp. LZ028]
MSTAKFLQLPLPSRNVSAGWLTPFSTRRTYVKLFLISSVMLRSKVIVSVDPLGPMKRRAHASTSSVRIGRLRAFTRFDASSLVYAKGHFDAYPFQQIIGQWRFVVFECHLASED